MTEADLINLVTQPTCEVENCIVCSLPLKTQEILMEGI